jgi:hypothetical protein
VLAILKKEGIIKTTLSLPKDEKQPTALSRDKATKATPVTKKDLHPRKVVGGFTTALTALLDATNPQGSHTTNK